MAEFPRQFIIFIGMKPQNIFFFALQNESNDIQFLLLPQKNREIKTV
jgi:hypothetical protein